LKTLTLTKREIYSMFSILFQGAPIGQSVQLTVKNGQIVNQRGGITQPAPQQQATTPQQQLQQLISQQQQQQQQQTAQQQQQNMQQITNFLGSSTNPQLVMVNIFVTLYQA